MAWVGEAAQDLDAPTLDTQGRLEQLTEKEQQGKRGESLPARRSNFQLPSSSKCSEQTYREHGMNAAPSGCALEIGRILDVLQPLENRFFLASTEKITKRQELGFTPDHRHGIILRADVFC